MPEQVDYIFGDSGGISIVSNMDYQNELVAEQAYKRDVCEGIYPNYKNLKLDCKEN